MDLVDETFDISQAGSYHLSIQTEPGGLSYCVFNTVINKYIVLRYYPFSAPNNDIVVDECKKIFDTDNLLGLSYKSCSHLWVSPRCTLVPEYLFDPAYAATYLNFNHGWKAGEQVLHNYILPARLYNVFSYPRSLLALLQRYHPSIKLFHQASLFLRSVVTKPFSTDKPRVVVYCYSDYMDIAIVQAKKILFYNTFQLIDTEDAVYYLAGVLNLFEMKLSSTKLYYTGSFKEALSRLETVRIYVERVVEFEPLDTVTYSHYLTEQIRARFIHLFNLYECVS